MKCLDILPGIVLERVLRLLSYSELLNHADPSDQLRLAIHAELQTRISNEPYEFYIDVEEEIVVMQEESSDTILDGYMEHLLGLSLHDPVVDYDTFDIIFSLICYDCAEEHECPCAFQEFHKDLVVSVRREYNSMVTLDIIQPGAERFPPLIRALQSGDICHYPIRQDMNAGKDSGHILLHFSPLTAILEYSASWQPIERAQNMCHQQLDTGVEWLMVRLESFRCSLLWWIHAVGKIEAAIQGITEAS